jgi:hypothetical protein
MREMVFEVKELADGGYSAHSYECCVFTEADDLEDLYRQVREAACCHCEECDQPETIRLRFSRTGGEEVISP